MTVRPLAALLLLALSGCSPTIIVKGDPNQETINRLLVDKVTQAGQLAEGARQAVNANGQGDAEREKKIDERLKALEPKAKP